MNAFPLNSETLSRLCRWQITPNDTSASRGDASEAAFVLLMNVLI